MKRLETKRLSPGSIRYKIQTGVPDQIPLLFISDVHYDSRECHRAQFIRHLEQAKQAGALVFITGDLLDVMGTHKDPRSKASDIDPRYLSEDFSYLDMVCEDVTDVLKPYAANIAMISEGNHETKIAAKHDTNPTRRIVKGLQEINPDVAHGHYSGFIQISEKTTFGNSHQTHKFTIHFHHGFGGSAHRSKGMLNVQTEVAKYPDADLLVRGHTHQKWYDPSSIQLRVGRNGRVYRRQLLYLQTGSYKESWGEGQGGFAVEKNFAMLPTGGWWVFLTRESERRLSVVARDCD